MVHSTAPQAKILGHSVTFARFYLQNSYFEDYNFQNFPCPQKVSGKNVYMGALKCFEYIRLRIYIYTKKNTATNFFVELHQFPTVEVCKNKISRPFQHSNLFCQSHSAVWSQTGNVTKP